MPSSSPLKVIIDTNLWISFLIGKQLASLKPLIVEGDIQPVFSQQSLDELIEVTQRPKLRRYFPSDKADELLIFLRAVSLLVESRSEVVACRDPKDNFLLAIAKDSQADFLITGDQDLLVLSTFETTRIVTYRDFLATLEP
jgi:putative PIN family toxin of toxin-antitoxin system